jgi:hypothetical protein
MLPECDLLYSPRDMSAVHYHNRRSPVLSVLILVHLSPHCRCFMRPAQCTLRASISPPRAMPPEDRRAELMGKLEQMNADRAKNATWLQKMTAGGSSEHLGRESTRTMGEVAR